MKRRLISTTILLLLMAVIVFGIITPSFAQGDKEREFYQYIDGEKQYLEVSHEWISVHFVGDVRESYEIQAMLKDAPNLGELSQIRTLTSTIRDVFLIPLRGGLDRQQWLSTLDTFRQIKGIKWANPVVVFRMSKYEIYCSYSDILTVTYPENMSREEINSVNQAFDVELEKRFLDSTFILRILPESEYDALQLAAMFYETGRVKYTSPIIECPPIIPTSMNDIYAPTQWDIRPHPGVGIALAHNTATGSGSIIIAIIDYSGFEMEHEEFKGKLTGSKDYKDDDNYPQPEPLYSAPSHGTTVAGSSGALTYNYRGIASACHGCRLMFLKPETLPDAAQAVRDATSLGAKVIVFGFIYPSSFEYQDLTNEISRATGYGNGVVVVVPAGNDGLNTIAYPANLDFVLAVGGSGQLGARWVNSNWGFELDVVAPAENLYATNIISSNPDPASDYYLGYIGGTSLAAPQVAGIAGLMLSVAPHLTDEQVRQIIKDTANAGTHTDIGAGIVDAAAAVGLALDTQPISDYTMPNDKFVTPLLILPQFPFISTQSSALALDDSDNLPASCAPQGYKQSLWYRLTPKHTQDSQLMAFPYDYVANPLEPPILVVYRFGSNGWQEVACSAGIGYQEQSKFWLRVEYGKAYQILLARKPDAVIPSRLLHLRITDQIPDLVGVFKPNSYGLFYLANSNSNSAALLEFNYGLESDLPVSGDWDGNISDTIGVYRQSEAMFYLKYNNYSQGTDRYVQYGAPGDIPITGDWDGDGVDGIGVYRNNVFMVRNTATPGLPDLYYTFGAPGDIPVAGDWNGDLRDTVGVFRPSAGYFYLSDEPYPFPSVNYYVPLGQVGDLPIAGDWDGDGDDSVGVYRPSTHQFFLAFDPENRQKVHAVFSLTYNGLVVKGSCTLAGQQAAA